MSVVCSKLRRKVAKFFGVADLNDIERKRFVDKWLTRAQKMHNDDFLLTRCKRRGSRLEYSRGHLPNLTLSAAQRQRRSSAPGDVTDAPCVLFIAFFAAARHLLTECLSVSPSVCVSTCLFANHA